MDVPDHTPAEVEFLEPNTLFITWADGHESLYPHRDLRMHCECAACVDEWTRKPLLDPSKVPEDVRVARWERTGRYGLNLHFSDGHSTGIHSFRSLRASCPCPDCRATAESR